MSIFRTSALAAVIAAAVASTASAAPPAPPAGAPNVVIVPGAFVDGSGWRVVFDILYHKGYKVTVVQPSHASLDADVAATRKVLDDQVGTVVLVGHDIGGSVISAAGARDKVKALVYVAALAPEVGETANQLLASIPAPGNRLNTNWAGLSVYDRASFHADYAADLTENRSNFMAASQMPVSQALMGTNSWSAIWHKKANYAIVASEDRIVSPELQRWMYKRAGAKVVELKASHAVHISQPEEVAKVIEQAALAAR